MNLTEQQIFQIRQNLPHIVKSIHEGFFDGMGERLKLYGQEIGQHMSAQYHKNNMRNEFEKQRRISDLEREIVHSKLATSIGLRPEYVSHHLNNTFNPSDPNQVAQYNIQQQLKGHLKVLRKADPQLRSFITNLTLDKRRSKNSFDVSAETLSQRTATDVYDQRAQQILGKMSLVDPSKPVPINPLKAADALRTKREALKQQRRQTIDTKIRGVTQFPSVTKPGPITKIGGNLLSKYQNLRNLYKNMSTIV